MKTYGYARVSTEEQESNGISLDAQSRTIREFCATEELTLAAVIREGESGKDVRGRPRLRRLLALAEGGRVSAIVVTHSSRLFRDFYEAVIYERRLKDWGVELRIIEQQWDETSAADIFRKHIEMAVNEYERRRIGERTRDALRRMKTSPGGTPLLDARADQGKLITGRAPYGFHWQDGDLVENATETKMVVIIRAWAGRGDRPTVIAARLNHQGYSTRSQGRWHHHQVSRILGRPY